MTTYTGGTGADSFVGGAGADTFYGGGGDDTFDGGAGVDTAVLSGARADYQVISLKAGGPADYFLYDLRSGHAGEFTETRNVETFQFSDTTKSADGLRAASFFGDTASVGNHLANGSFELHDPATLSFDYIEAAPVGISTSASRAITDLLGWTVSGPVSLSAPLPDATHAFASELRTDGFAAVRFASGGGLSQAVTGLSAGASLDLSFAVAGGPGALQAIWDGAVVATVDPNTVAQGHFVHVQVVASGGTDTLAFQWAGGGAGAGGLATLDDVRLYDSGASSVLGGSIGLTAFVANYSDDPYVAANGVVTPAEHAMSSDGVRAALQGVGYQFGSAFNDVIIGSPGGDTFYGGSAGVDSIYGGGGNDSLGGFGVEHLYGGDGNDTLALGGDTTGVFDGGAGSDTIQTGILAAGDVLDLSLGGVTHTTGSDASSSTVLEYHFVSIENAFVAGGAVTGDGGDNVLRGVLDPSAYAALPGGSSAVTIYGGGGNDSLEGSSFADQLYGGAGDDTIRGGYGHDSLFGGDGNDVFAVDNGSAVIDGGTGVNTISFAGVPAFGTLGGIYVDLSQSTAFAAFGQQTLSNIQNAIGAVTDDHLTGDAGANALSGGDGNDVLHGGGGADTLDGGLGLDTADYAGSAAGVSLNLSVLSPGPDGQGAYVHGAGGDAAGDLLSGIENLNGSAFADTLTGDAGPNVLHGGAGADLLDGGDGIDTADYAGSSAGVFVNLGAVSAGPGGQGAYVHGSGGDAAGDLLSGIENLSGSAFADTLDGSAGANALFGGAGNDLLAGGAGDDQLDGGAGADQLQGGLGDDVYVVADAQDQLFERAGEGTDTVLTTLGSFTLGANFENLTAGGGYGPYTLVGNALANVITGGAGADMLDGGQGADTVYGGGGSDTISVDNAGDVVFGGANASATVIVSNSAFHLNANSDVGTLIAAGTLGIALYGTDGDQHLIGNGAANILDGGAGNDTLEGGAGNDTYILHSPYQQVVEAANGGYDTVKTDASYIFALADNVEALTYTGADAFSGAGNALANLITGGAGADTLDGRGGADTLVGGAGADTYDVDDPGDVVTEQANGGHDAVFAALSAYTLAINVEDLTYTGFGAFNGVGNASANLIDASNASSATLHGGSGADTLVGSSGDDSLYGDGGPDSLEAYPQFGEHATLYGGAGDDAITVGGSGATQGAADVYGGDGADTLTLGEDGPTIIFDGGAGADRVDGQLWPTGRVTLTLGAGSDTVSLAHDPGDVVFTPGYEADIATITDFQAGAGGDVLDLAPLVAALRGASLHLVQIGPDTLVQFDSAGDGSNFLTAFTLSGVQASTLTAFNLGGRTVPVVLDAAAPALARVDLPDTLSLDAQTPAVANTVVGATDTGSGVRSVSLVFDRDWQGPTGPTHVLGFSAAGGGFSGNVASTSLIVEPGSAFGHYAVVEADVTDFAGNVARYSASQLAALGLDSGFDVLDARPPPPLPRRRRT